MRPIKPLLPLALLLALGCLASVGCSKQKTCRCAVVSSKVANNSTVRVITIDKGECDQLLVYDYHEPTETNVTDTLYCTDYEFMIDSVYKN